MRVLFKSSTSAFFEIESSSPYYAEKPYDVYLNGNKVISERRENTFSLFSLTPDTEYGVRAGEEFLVFKTDRESAAISVLDFGAKGDGVCDDTDAIRTAIESCPKDGRISFPKGTYLTGPIRLKSDITVELSEGAVLLGVTDTERYPVLPAYVTVDGQERIYSVFEGVATPCYSSFVSAYFEKNIKIIGEGVIDANAQNSVWWTQEFVRDTAKRRPRLLFLNGCENVKIHGITGRNGASWNFHPFFSKDLGIYDLKVFADKSSPNTDGLDPECCDGVEIVGCRFSVGDDCIAIKSGKIDIGRRYNATAKNHTVRNCIMEFGHGGVVLGSEIGSGVSELRVSQCIFNSTERGLRIKSRRGRGKNCVVDRVFFDNISMQRVGVPLVINMHYNLCDPDGKSDRVQSREPLPVDDTTPRMGKFVFKNLKCTDSEVAAGYFEGLAEMPIEEVSLENVSVSFKTDAKEGLIDAFLPRIEVKKQGLTFTNVKTVSLKNVTVENYEGEEIIYKNCETIRSE